MILGCDLDGVLFDFSTPLKKKLKDKLNIDFNIHDIRSYEISEILPCSKDEVLDCILEVIVERDRYDTYPHAVEVLRRVSITDPPIIFITSRRPKYYDITHKAICNSTGIHESKFHLLHEQSKKSEIVNTFQCDFYIEDRKKFAEEVKENTNSRVLLLDRKWNEHCEHIGVQRVYGWPEIEKIMYG